MPGGAGHFAFAAASADDYALWKKRLGAENIAYKEEDHGTQRSVYFADPNGLMIEITTPAPSDAPDPGAGEVVKRWLGQAPPGRSA